MKFKKGEKITGERCFIVLGGHTEISHLDLSALHIAAEYKDWDRKEKFYLESTSPHKIDLGFCQIIPIIIPWNQRAFQSFKKFG